MYITYIQEDGMDAFKTRLMAPIQIPDSIPENPARRAKRSSPVRAKAQAQLTMSRVRA